MTKRAWKLRRWRERAQKRCSHLLNAMYPKGLLDRSLIGRHMRERVRLLRLEGYL